MNRAPPEPLQMLVRWTAGALCVFLACTLLLGLLWVAIDPDSVLLATGTGVFALLTVLSGAWLVAGLVLGARRLPLIMLLSMFSSLVGVMILFALMLFEDTLDSSQHEVVLLLGLACLLPALALIHNGGLSLLRTRGVLLIVKSITMICVWVFIASVLGLYLLEELVYGGPSFPGFAIILPVMALGAGGTLAGTVLVPIVALSAANRETRPAESIASRPALDMACPSCGNRKAFPAGNARCPACRARLFIEIEEPRCACGYLLYRLQGDVCPECGRAIPPEMRWRETEPEADPGAGGLAASE
ncbi:MAG: hypothetical protein SYC29_02400 [Planctomycetota bacterium]|nr:hypothetical protein [Planctomycetota bacterium]